MNVAGGEFEDGDFAFLLGKFGDQVGVIHEDDAVGVFFHLGDGEEATDAGHAVDVGDVDGFLSRQMIFSQGAESGVGFLACCHVVADQEEACFGRLKGEGGAMLIWGAECLDGLALLVGLRDRRQGAEKSDGEEHREEGHEI